MKPADFPRVLFITPCAFNRLTGGGITFTSLFRGWPEGKIATITGDRVPVTRDVCRHYYFLTGKELKKIRPFSWVWQGSTSHTPLGMESAVADGPAAHRAALYRFAKTLLGEAGIPDRGDLSQDLKKWVDAFRPELIYTILGTPGYADLVTKISRRNHLPVVVHLMDDGETDPVRSGLLGPHLRGLYRRKLRATFRETRQAIAICEQMADAYRRRYGIPFIHFQNAVDLQRWKPAEEKHVDIESSPRIVYIGSVLKSAQADSLLDCCAAVRLLNEQGFKISFDIFSQLAMMQRKPEDYRLHENIRIQNAPEDDHAFFDILKKADLLLLPVNFDKASFRYIRYSMPTKIPSYLVSGTPVLVYGPGGVAQVEYARDEGWGHVVDKADVPLLAGTIRELMATPQKREALSTRALEIVAKNHDIQIVRTGFQSALAKVVKKEAPSIHMQQ
ncbi:MAG: glycosyltransferase [Pseudomonadota bacterium]